MSVSLLLTFSFLLTSAKSSEFASQLMATSIIAPDIPLLRAEHTFLPCHHRANGRERSSTCEKLWRHTHTHIDLWHLSLNLYRGHQVTTPTPPLGDRWSKGKPQANQGHLIYPLRDGRSADRPVLLHKWDWGDMHHHRPRKGHPAVATHRTPQQNLAFGNINMLIKRDAYMKATLKKK